MTREEFAMLKKGDKLYYSGFAGLFEVVLIADIETEEDGLDRIFLVQGVDNPKHEFWLNAKYSRRLLLDRLRKVKYKKLRSYG